MAAFSYQHQPFLHDDSVFFPSIIKIPGFSEEPNTPTTCFSQFYHSDPLQEIPISNHEHSVTNKHSTESSSVVDKFEFSEQVTQKINPMEEKRKNRDGSSSNSAQSKDPKEVRGKKKKRCNGNEEVKKAKADKKEKKVQEEEEAPPKGYIHVRARRGQATDSHSLAERVRREKISERMKLLQALVPGCDKVTGKALMLDEIINYVQYLISQVEFLSMKLASVNPFFYDFGGNLDSFMVRPESLESPVPNGQQSSAAQTTAFSDATTTTFTTANNYSLLDTSSSILLQQGQSPHVLSQDNGQLLWDVDDQRQKLANQIGIINNLCAFN